MNAQTVGNLTPEASRLFRVQKTCWKMLRKRGYHVDDSYIHMTTEAVSFRAINLSILPKYLKKFNQEFGDIPARERLTILVQKVDDPDEQLFVFFPDTGSDAKAGADKIGVSHLKGYYGRMKTENVRRAIIIVRSNLTPFAKQLIKEVTMRGFRMEYFRENELLVDITEHKLVPEHIVLSQQEKQELLDRYRLKPSQLPRIQVTDPMARYLGLKPNQVVKIIRPSETAGRYITYRICI